MFIYILLSGIGIGIVVGFCIKLYCCKDDKIYMESEQEPEQEPEQEQLYVENNDENINNRNYIHFLENMLDNSTEVATNSFTLHHADVSYNNLSPDVIIIPPNPPSDSHENIFEAILCDISYTSVEEV